MQYALTLAVAAWQVGGLPGKQLLAALYTEFCTERGPLPAESQTTAAGDAEAQAAAKKERFEQWKDMSELLGSAVRMLFSRAEESLGA